MINFKNSSKFPVYILVNSTVGKRGNIGFRTAKIIDEANSQGLNIHIFSRRSIGYKNLNTNFYEVISRALNFIRIYLIRNINHVKIDDYIFQLLEKYIGRSKVKKIDNKLLIHSWGPYTKSLSYYKKMGYKIVLDVPIASNLHAIEIYQKTKFQQQNNKKEINSTEQIAFKLADKIIVPSKFVADGIKRNYKIDSKKLQVVPFGVNYKQYHMNRSYPKKTDGLKFIFTGTLNQRKGVFDLLEAWNTELFKNDTLILCGRIFPEIKAQVRKVQNGGKVKLVGHVEVTDYLKDSDIFVFPSYMEGSAKSVYEALATGLPVLTTENAGSIIVNDVTGLLIKPGCIASLREKMLELKMDYLLRKRIGFAGQKEVENYSWSRYSKNICEVYYKVSKGLHHLD
jgi:glycosyltransferase involved in cell wall biosynthesis